MSKAVVLAALVRFSSALAVPTPDGNSSTVNGWDKITPSTEVNWIPCFGKWECFRLKVPLDYDDPEVGSAGIAMLKYSAKKQPAKANILINPGGPGDSGVETVIGACQFLADVFGDEYNFIGFDPRGVGNSEPDARIFGYDSSLVTWLSWWTTVLPDDPLRSMGTYLARAKALGQWITRAIGGPHGAGRYLSTTAVARDMLAYIEAEERAAGKPGCEAKLWYYGLSYGTVLGQTFASMFPDRVHRMILDGVVDTEAYYNGTTAGALQDADDVVHTFFEQCHRAGPRLCPFYHGSPEEIQRAMDELIERLTFSPIPVSNSSVTSSPQVATSAYLRNALMSNIYEPIAGFPRLASILSGVAEGNGDALIEFIEKDQQLPIVVSPLITKKHWVVDRLNSQWAIVRADTWGHSLPSTTKELAAFVEGRKSESRYIGSQWAQVSLGSLAVDIEPPIGALIKSQANGQLPLSAKTDFPILFFSNVYDPVTPLASAHRMSARFPGSVVIEQNTIGHGALTAGLVHESCLARAARKYLSGTMPEAGIRCEPARIPFDLNESLP